MSNTTWNLKATRPGLFLTEAVTVTVSPFCFDSSEMNGSVLVWGGGVVPDSDIVSLEVLLDVALDCVPLDAVLEVSVGVLDEVFEAVTDSVGVEALGFDEVLSVEEPPLVTDEVL